MDPYIVLLCEVNNQEILDNIIEYLKYKGKIYYGHYAGKSPCLLSKYPINTSIIREGVAKATLVINEQRFAVYSIHLDHQYAAEYYPRGYDGQLFAKLEKPIIDEQQIIEYSRHSARAIQTSDLLVDVNKEKDRGSLIIIGGDFNEPSYLDWQENTKNIRDHNGVVVNWESSKLLDADGLKDTYREIFPNPITHPAFTFAAGNTHPDIDESVLKLVQGVDNRERLDRIYYYPNKQFTLTNIAIVGPEEDFFDGVILEETMDNIITPESGFWVSDHKGNYAEFELLLDE